MRYETFINAKVKLTDLKLDLANPRIGHKKDAAACIEAILNSKNFINLVADIATNGLGFSPIVAYEDDNKKLTVMDGNRRLTALKLITKPDLASTHSLVTKIKEHAKVADDNSLSFETISIYKSSELEAIYDHMRLTHTGENEGVGQKRWTAMAQALFAIDHGIPDDNLLAAKLIIFAQSNNGFTFDDDYPITALTRVINRERLLKLGITESDGIVMWESKSDNREKMFIAILTDIRDQTIITKNVFSPDQQNAYLSNLFNAYSETPYAKQVVPPAVPTTPADPAAPTTTATTATTATTVTTATTAAPAAPTTPAATGNTPPSSLTSPAKSSWDRPKVVNGAKHKFDFTGHSDKLRNIYTELKTLKLDGKDGTPNAAVFLIRAFTELSIASYMQKHAFNEESLQKDAKKTAHTLEQDGKIHADLKLRIFQMGNADAFLSFRSLQKYVHSTNYHPNKQHINTLWDELYPFLLACLKD